MRMYDLIMKKRNGQPLTKEEIYYFVEGYTSGKIPDYQASALMMAIYFQKMTHEETLALTLAMAESGEQLDLSSINGAKADKHSTGGVGDKTSLVLAPMAASLGVKMAKMSGRGLGHTGGTIDKLESFDGFLTALSKEQFLENISKVGMAITGQTGNLAPADKKLYALRDVTATVDNISLIASSIMSKKLAAGAGTIVLDVKCGNGAFMKTQAEAEALAEEMVRIGTGAGRNTTAVVSGMDEPLGFAVGNALEVKEAIDTLRGNGPNDLLELCLTLGSYILMGTGMASDEKSARKQLSEAVSSGAALEKFAEFVEAQGGRREQVYDYSSLPEARFVKEIYAPKTGYISNIRSEEVGLAVMALGGGREIKTSEIDLSAGVVLKKKTGSLAVEGETIAVVHGSDEAGLDEAAGRLQAAFSWSETPVSVPALVKKVITSKSGCNS